MESLLKTDVIKEKLMGSLKCAGNPPEPPTPAVLPAVVPVEVKPAVIEPEVKPGVVAPEVQPEVKPAVVQPGVIQPEVIQPEIVTPPPLAKEDNVTIPNPDSVDVSDLCPNIDRADIVFMVDESGSVKPKGWKLQKQFVNKIIDGE